MIPTEINKFRKVLEATVIEFDQVTRRRDAIRIEPAADELERGLQAGEREFAMQYLEVGCINVREARAALQRIQEGTYGICLECEDEIEEKRLAAIPYARLCIICQEAMDCNCGAKGAKYARPAFANAA